MIRTEAHNTFYSNLDHVLSIYPNYRTLEDQPGVTKKTICDKIINAIEHIKYKRQQTITPFDELHNEEEDINCNYIAKINYLLFNEFNRLLKDEMKMEDALIYKILTIPSSENKFANALEEIIFSSKKIESKVNQMKEMWKNNEYEIQTSKDHPCPKCHARDAIIRRAMTRSLDEGIGHKKLCNQCGFWW
jgi:DNA-directed RNA polymerase subunit M/transcription elongation factor TFIIS